MTTINLNTEIITIPAKARPLDGKNHLCLSGLFSVDCSRREGLILLWRKLFEVKILSSFLGHIDCIVSWKLILQFTGFDGHPETQLRVFSWRFYKD